jgi:hypothetical protein
MKKKTILVLHLEITDWLGSIGATHYYGKITFPHEIKKEDIELGYIMSRADATQLNKLFFRLKKEIFLEQLSFL